MFEIVLLRRFDFFKKGLVRTDCGSVFHNLEAEYEKERSYTQYVL